MMKTIAVSKLVHSPRNGRQPERFASDSDYHQTADIEAQILEFGLLHAPVAHPMPRGRFGVFIGGRRLLSLQRLITRGDLPKNHEIDISVRDEADLMLAEMSFAENATRVALPAVTEYETYAKLVADGLDIAAIAHRYQTTELHVRQRMRLGQLHPEIRAELGADRLSLDMARAFGATADQELQKRIFDLRPTHPYEVRAAMKREATSAGVDRMLSLVGMDAYVAAGGRAEEDLFQTGEPRLLDLDVLRGLFDAKLAQERLRLHLPDDVPLQFGPESVGARVEIEDQPSDEQRERLRAIDARLGVLDEYLDNIAEWDHDGPMPRLVALAGEEQSTVDNFQTERVALGKEIDTIADATGWPDGPLIAVGAIAGESVKLTGYYRPLGWQPDRISTSVTAAADARPAPATSTTSPTTSPTTEPAKPVISGFRSDRHQFTGGHIYRQPEEVAREEHGLTKDGVDAMRSHHRQILGAALLTGPISMRLAHRYLIFVLARGMLRAGDRDGYQREGAADLGTDRLPSHDYDPAHVRADLAGQPGADTQRDAIERLRTADWMQEPDTAAALRRFATAGLVDLERAGACVAVAMLSRSLGIIGFEVPVHQVLAELLNIEADVRDHWRPDTAFFARLPKNRKLEAIRFVDEAVAKRLANLGTDELSETAAAIMGGDRAAAEKYGLSRDAQIRAQAWVPAYLSFAPTDAPDEDEEDSANDHDADRAKENAL